MAKITFKLRQIGRQRREIGVAFFGAKLKMIKFYLPLEEAISMPESPEKFWYWLTHTPGLLEYISIYHWILLTYLQLKKRGFPCALVRDMPKEGVVIAHHLTIPPHLKPTEKLTVVDVLVDKAHHTYFNTNFYIIHNQAQKIFFSRCFYISPWPQSQLISRDPQRENLFKNIAFVGTKQNELAKELKSSDFGKQLKTLGLTWYIPERKDWNDLSQVDALIAIRSFKHKPYFNKPALKLINAWKAGVPIIAGDESSYRKIGKPDFDYLEAKSYEELISHIKRLKNDPNLCRRLVENGRKKAAQFSDEKIAKQWVHFLKNAAIPYHHKFTASKGLRSFFIFKTFMKRNFYKIGRRICSVIR